MSEQRKCKRDGQPIEYVPVPDRLPEGYVFGMWEGWRHVDSKYEHFCPVGWYDLRPRRA